MESRLQEPSVERRGNVAQEANVKGCVLELTIQQSVP